MSFVRCPALARERAPQRTCCPPPHHRATRRNAAQHNDRSATAHPSRQAAFAERGVELLGLSIDSIHAHIGWVMSIKSNFGIDIGFPIIADLDMAVARSFGMIHPEASTTAAVRSVFVIDPDRKLRARIEYPMSVGRNFDEILRLVDALQTAHRDGVACPANWTPGEPVIIPPPGTVAEAKERLADASLDVTDWYFAKSRS